MIPKERRRIRSLQIKKETSPSLKRSPQTPRRSTFRRIKVNVKVASVHTVVRDFIPRALA